MASTGSSSSGDGRPDDVLERFSAPTRDWFRGAFERPTAAQEGAWRAISSGDHALVVAPTGSGKTLSAFLWALDRLAADGRPEDPLRRTRVIYVSPLKALATDVERNLRSPLLGIGYAARRLGLPVPEVSVSIRSGDTPADERRAFTRRPPDVLITTPESLFLLLTAKAREVLGGVETVILDEVHAVAGTKRGAHLALTLERLDALLEAGGGRPAQRIGLSATVRPVEDVARFLAGARPVGEAAEGADGGGRPVTIVQPASVKTWDLSVVVPVPDMGELGQVVEEDLTGLAAGEPQRRSIWPALEERVVDLVAAHRSTIVFANSRRVAERLTTRLNEVWAERNAQPEDEVEGEGLDDDAGQRLVGRASAGSPAGPTRPPAEVMAQAGQTRGTPASAPVLARAHHGSVSREQRSLIEEDLKAGRLPAVVATSSLELGIDMGAVDLVIQVGSPPSVASGLQRVGRAGHQVGATSRGALFPQHRSDLVQTAVVTERMRTGGIEALKVPASPLDVLAQQVVAMTAMDEVTVEELERVVRRAAPFSGLTRGVLEAVLDMLAGRYPSEEFAELRPRIVWDRLTGVLTGRPGAQRLAVTSGGTIPDRGLYGVFLAAGEGPGRRVGELDEEMVYESRVGDVFTLGTSTWRIEDITSDRVLVTPAPGVPGKLPFWHGEAIGRPYELGRAIGAFTRELGAQISQRSTAAEDGDGDDAAAADPARERARAAGLDDWAADNLLAYLREQQESTGHLPDDRTIVVERFRDELGDWRVVLHSPFGAQLHAPWALALTARLRERFGLDAQAMSADDGIVLRLPDLDLLSGAWDGDGGEALLGSSSGSSSDALGGGLSARSEPPDVLEAVLVEPEDLEALVTAELGGSALFASRFRECAARSLLLPRRRPDRRTPLWQQRQRAAQLLEVASRYPSFPVVLETAREVLSDVFDVPGLEGLLRDLRSGAVRVVQVTTEQPSPFARSLLFGYVAQFLYEGDTPLAEKRAAALSLDPTLLAELLGRGDGASLADLLDAEQLTRTQSELQRLAPDRRARDGEDVADLLRVLGPLTTAEVAVRSRGEAAAPFGDDAEAADAPTASERVVSGWLVDLEEARRVIRVRIAGQERWAAIEDAGRLRDALGAPLPVGVPEAFTAPVPDPVADLVSRWARSHAPFTAATVAARLGTGVAVVVDALKRLAASGRVVSGDLLPPEVRLSLDGSLVTAPGGTPDWCDAEVLRLLRRRSLAALRSEVEPVPPRDLARFLPGWQQVGSRLRGADGLLRAVEQLAGAVVPASALETLVLPVRVERYAPALLDELTAAGEVVWQGHGSLPGEDGWVSLHAADAAPVTLALPDESLELTDVHRAVLEVLAGGGAHFFRSVAGSLEGQVDAEGKPLGGVDDATLERVLWDLAWGGYATNDTLAPLRARLSGGRTAHRAPRSTPRARYGRTSPTGARYGGLGRAGGGLGRPGGGFGGAPRTGPPSTAGRWSLLPDLEPDATVRASVTAEVLLDRHGVLTRGAVASERLPGGFAAVYRVLAAMEEAGRVRRGYFVEGLGASQFASTGAVDRLRAASRPLSTIGRGEWQRGTPGGGRPDAGSSDPWQAAGLGPAAGAKGSGSKDGPDTIRTVVLAAADPANPYGAALPWPERETSGAAGTGHRPGRKAGALVVLLEGDLVLYVERGGRTLLSFTEDGEALQAGADALALAVRDGALGRLTVEKADGAGVLVAGSSPLASALEAAGFTATPRGLRVRS